MSDTQRWIAHTADGREIAITITGDESFCDGAGAMWQGSDGIARALLSGAGGDRTIALRMTLRVIDETERSAIVEVHREGEPSRTALLAAVAAARAALEHYADDRNWMQNSVETPDGKHLRFGPSQVYDGGSIEEGEDGWRVAREALAALDKVQT